MGDGPAQAVCLDAAECPAVAPRCPRSATAASGITKEQALKCLLYGSQTILGGFLRDCDQESKLFRS
jgi:hypothetical protein